MSSTYSESESDSFSEDEVSINDDKWMSRDSGEKDEEVLKSKPKLSKHLEQLQRRLGLEELKNKLSTAQENKETKPSSSKPEPLVVVYNDPSKRKKLKILQKPNVSSKSEAEESFTEAGEFNLIKAKHDVQKFTIQSLKKTSKEKARVALAVKLGAKAPKPDLANYKMLKNRKKNDIARLKKLKDSNEHVFTSKLQLMNKNKGPKRDKNKVVNFDSNFGKYGPKLKKQINSGNKFKK